MTTENKSIRDFGYQVAQHGDMLIADAMDAVKLIPGFPDNVADEIVAEFKAGCILRKADLVKPTVYIREGVDNYVISDGKPPKGATTLKLDVAYAMTYTPQLFGALRKTQPNLHRMVKVIRDDVSKYASNKWNGLVATYKRATAGPRDRSVNKSFSDWLDDTLAAILKRAKTAASRGDTSVPSDKAGIRKLILDRLA